MFSHEQKVQSLDRVEGEVCESNSLRRAEAFATVHINPATMTCHTCPRRYKSKSEREALVLRHAVP
jgi:hypothetical protein